jgi:peptide/nickel transport system permease protein
VHDEVQQVNPLPLVERAPASNFSGRHRVIRFAAIRTGSGLVTLLIASVLIFVLVQVVPGDPARAMLGRAALPGQVRVLRRALGLDEPVPERYWHWLSGVLHGNLGTTSASIAGGDPRSVWLQIDGPLQNSAILGLLAFVLIAVASLTIGTLSALRRDTPYDHVLAAVTLTLSALPEFVIAAFLILVFFTVFGLFSPVSLVPPGDSPLRHINTLILPLLTLMAAGTGVGARMIRAGVIETLDKEYVRVARLNGVRERRVLLRYVIRNSLGPSVQVFGLIAQYLFGGLLVVESVFGYPGVGTEMVRAVSVRDATEITSLSLLIAAIYIAINVASDLLVLALVPKLRAEV